MKFVRIALLSILIAYASCDASASFRKFKIDLSLEPEQRYLEVTKVLRNETIQMYMEFLEEVPDFAKSFFSWTSWLWWVAQYEKYQEIKGIVAGLNTTDITIEQAITINSLYELESWCTSIITQTQDGQIMHARNMDFDNAATLRKGTYVAQFYNGSAELFEGTMFSGIIGVYTGIKKGAFSISVNQREVRDKEQVGLVENLSMIMAGFDQISWLLRDTLIHCNDFDCAHKKLNQTKVNGIGYIILAGTKMNEGVVMTRDRTETAHLDALDSFSQKWYVVQTNSDHWKNGCTGRCERAHENLNKVSQSNITHNTLRHDVLLQYPNFNQMTIYNTAFDPLSGMQDSIPVTFTPKHAIVRESIHDFKKFKISRDLTLTDPMFFFKNPDVAFGMVEKLISLS